MCYRCDSAGVARLWRWGRRRRCRLYIGSPRAVSCLLGGFGFAFAVGLVEEDFAEAHGVGCDLDVLVALDVLKSLLEREDGGRGEVDCVVGAFGAHIGEFLTLADVDDDVALACVLTYDLAGVDFVAGVNKELAVVLEFVEGVGVGCAAFECYERAVDALVDVAFPGFEAEESVCHDGFAGGGSHEVGAQTDDAAGGDFEVLVDAVAVSFHVDELAFALCDHLDGLAGAVFGEVDGEFLDWFAFLAVDFLYDYLWLSDLEFVAFAAHCLDED